MRGQDSSLTSRRFEGRRFVDPLMTVPLLPPAGHRTLQPGRVLPWRQTVRLAGHEAVAGEEAVASVHDVAAGHLRPGLEGRVGVLSGPELLHQVDLEDGDGDCC